AVEVLEDLLRVVVLAQDRLRAEVLVPDAVFPDTVFPDTVFPDAVLPDAVLPDPVFPDAILPDAILPDAVLPDAVFPDAVHDETVAREAVFPDAVGAGDRRRFRRGLRLVIDAAGHHQGEWQYQPVLPTHISTPRKRQCSARLNVGAR